MRKGNVRYVEVAVAQTDFQIIAPSDKAQVVGVLVRRASGTAVETFTLKSGGVTKFDLKVAVDYDMFYPIPGDMDVQGLTVTTSAQAHAWVIVAAETNKGVIPDLV